MFFKHKILESELLSGCVVVAAAALAENQASYFSSACLTNFKVLISISLNRFLVLYYFF